MTEVNNINLTTLSIIKVVTVVVLVWLLFVVRDLLVMLFAAVIISSAIEPAANRLAQFKVPRAMTVVVIYLFIILFLVGVGALMAEPIAKQSVSLAQHMPQVVNNFYNLLPFLPQYNQEQLIGTFQQGLMKFGNNITNVGINVFASTRNFVVVLVNILFVFVIALYLVVEKNGLQKLVRLVVPEKYIENAERAVVKIQRSLGRWVLGQLSLGVMVGSMVGIGMWALGVPYALLLGLISGVLEFIPVIGPILSAIPGVLLALSQSWFIGLLAWAYYVFVGQVESLVFIPSIMKRAVGLKPLVTIVAVLVGGRLFGMVGILLAVPTATVIKIILTEYWRKD